MDSMFSMVKERLKSLGYIAKPEEELVLNFCIQKVEREIKNECNIALIPDGLQGVAIDMTCGEFLFGAKSTGQLAEFDFDAVVKSIDEGDIKVSFAISDGSTTEQRFDRFVAYLLSRGKEEFMTYRRMSW